MAQSGQQPPPVRLTLKQAVANSVQKSREVSLARLQYQSSREESSVARAQFLPNFLRGFRRGLHQRLSDSGGRGRARSFNLTYNQELFNLPARGDVHADEQKARAAAAGSGRGARRRHRAHGLRLSANWRRFGNSLT